uniref:phage terminase small subunit n=1 Tax=Paenibacillus sp. FSL H8-0332 TaxID=2954742 RepID=UPI00403F2BF3
MTREKSPDREKALKIWLKSGWQRKPSEIAKDLGVSPSLVRKWKSTVKWKDIPETAGRRGAPKGNINAKGNKGGKGGPEENQKALKHGFFSKFMPQDPEYMEIREIVETMSPADMIWENMLSLYQRSCSVPNIPGFFLVRTFVTSSLSLTCVIRRPQIN